ncbi:MAG: hypothetical protein EP297_14240 [Gammaproteobacteria bacterium]|nr:MAG: hypothetical protein EP297_14240 [Gammaproteobacteria bacterium]
MGPFKQLVTLAILMCATTSPTFSGEATVFKTAEDLFHHVVHLLCEQRELPFQLISNEPMRTRGRTIGRRYLYHVRPLGKLQIETISLDTKPLSYRISLFNDSGKPALFTAIDSQCRIQLARKIMYEDDTAISLLHLDNGLAVTTRTDPVNPEVPAGKDPGGVRIGIIDSGVNYLLPEIHQRMARNADGEIIGYDYWDLDEQPFDSNPAKSEFFPQRHGTRTASLLLREAPAASLVPYRYPRPDTTRFTDLINHAARNRVRIIAMPLGSKDRDEWLPFYHSARAHPEILFIISSGNNGVNIDEHPIYPAAFNLDNLITVSAADEIPVPAAMTNWGKNSTDLLLPADRQFTTDFDGREKMVSGTSYAVSRIAALAARIAQQHEDWSTIQIKQHIISMADPNHSSQYTAYGLINDPLIDTAIVTHVSSERLHSEISNNNSTKLELHVVLLEESGWTTQQAHEAIIQAQKIYSQCNIDLEVTLGRYSVPDYLLDFHSLSSRTLIDKINIVTPTIFLVRDTRRLEAFGGEAFGKANTRKIPWLENTAWLITHQKDIGIIFAHELFHILVDNGDHNDEPSNLMNEDTYPNNTVITPAQCEQISTSRLFSQQPQ